MSFDEYRKLIVDEFRGSDIVNNFTYSLARQVEEFMEGIHKSGIFLDNRLASHHNLNALLSEIESKHKLEYLHKDLKTCKTDTDYREMYSKNLLSRNIIIKDFLNKTEFKQLEQASVRDFLMKLNVKEEDIKILTDKYCKNTSGDFYCPSNGAMKLNPQMVRITSPYYSCVSQTSLKIPDSEIIDETVNYEYVHGIRLNTTKLSVFGPTNTSVKSSMMELSPRTITHDGMILVYRPDKHYEGSQTRILGWTEETNINVDTHGLIDDTNVRSMRGVNIERDITAKEPPFLVYDGKGYNIQSNIPITNLTNGMETAGIDTWMVLTINDTKDLERVPIGVSIEAINNFTGEDIGFAFNQTNTCLSMFPKTYIKEAEAADPKIGDDSENVSFKYAVPRGNDCNDSVPILETTKAYIDRVNDIPTDEVISSNIATVLAAMSALPEFPDAPVRNNIPLIQLVNTHPISSHILGYVVSPPSDYVINKLRPWVRIYPRVFTFSIRNGKPPGKDNRDPTTKNFTYFGYRDLIPEDKYLGHKHIIYRTPLTRLNASVVGINTSKSLVVCNNGVYEMRYLHEPEDPPERDISEHGHCEECYQTNILKDNLQHGKKYPYLDPIFLKSKEGNVQLINFLKTIQLISDDTLKRMMMTIVSHSLSFEDIFWEDKLSKYVVSVPLERHVIKDELISIPDGQFTGYHMSVETMCSKEFLWGTHKGASEQLHFPIEVSYKDKTRIISASYFYTF